MQAPALLEAASARIQGGGKADPEITIRLVDVVRELDLIRDRIPPVVKEVAEQTGIDVPLRIGTMIELLRAIMTAGHIAESAEFFKFGTNDLPRRLEASRDDVEASIFSTYLEPKVFPVSPFASLDIDVVGALVRMAVESGRGDQA